MKTNTDTRITVNPTAKVALYTDAILVDKSQYGYVFNFIQGKEVISRIGMSQDHVKAFYKVLSKEL